MADLTNDLLRALIDTMGRVNTALDTLNAPSNTASAMGVQTSPNTPFFRMGEPLIIPVNPTPSRFADFTVPTAATTFRIVNNNPFGVRLRGQKDGVPYVAITSTTGWLWLPGTTEVYGTVFPIALSTMSVDGPFAASDPTQKAGTGVLELQYGTGS